MSNLHDREASVEFYELRYAKGYMDEWPAQKRKRIFELVRSLRLPSSSVALDFGCGNGVLTEVLRKALPDGSKVYGTDISTHAVQNAEHWFPRCTFLPADSPALKKIKFDFLFTHHVLEHVYDLTATLVALNSYMKPVSVMLHILPCGNQESFEQSVCLMRSNGIDTSRENRFFFEEEGHLRRLTTDSMQNRFRPFNFSLAEERYANQYYGAIDWITRSRPNFIWRFAHPKAAINRETKKRMRRLRNFLLTLWFLRYPAVLLESRLRKRQRSLTDWLLLAGAIPLYAFAKPMDAYLNRAARVEWQTRNTERNGSEMYLAFRRGGDC